MVNPADGNITFTLPIATPAARGPNLRFGVKYTSAEPFYLENITQDGSGANWRTPLQNGQPQPLNINGWSYALPSYSAQSVLVQSYPVNCSPSSPCSTYNYCYAAGNYTFQGLDGSAHTLEAANLWLGTGSSDTYQNSCGNYGYAPFQGGLNQEGISTAFGNPTFPGSNYQPTMAVTDRSGTVYSFPQIMDFNVGGPFGSLAQSITDRNGNTVSLSGSDGTLGGSLPAGSYNTIGGSALSWTGMGSSSGDQIQVAGLGPVVVKWGTATVTMPGSDHTLSSTDGSKCGVGASAPLSLSVVSEIDLPNGTKYTFSYGGTYGLLNKITFPDGGYVRYDWGLNPEAKVNNDIYTYYWYMGSRTGQCYAAIDMPAVSDRYVSADGTTEVLHQHFSYSTTIASTNDSWSSKTTTVTSSDAVSGQAFSTTYNYSSVSPELGPNDGPHAPTNTSGGFLSPAEWQVPQVPVEAQITQSALGGSVLQTENKTWFDQYTMIGDQTISSNGQGRTELRCPDAYDNITAIYDYDYQSAGGKGSDPSCPRVPSPLSSGLNSSAMGPLLRSVKSVYHNFGSSALIHDEPDSITTWGPTGQIAQTTFLYDQGDVQGSGTQTGLVSPPGARGNATTVSRSVDTAGTVASTTYSYFDTGQIASKSDACGNTTCSDMVGSSHKNSYSYTDSPSGGNPGGNSNAYLTQVTDALGHTQNFSYNYSTGMLASATDANGNTSNYTYADSLGRLTEAQGPSDPNNGGQRPTTTYSYNDTSPSPSVTTSTLMSGSTYHTTVAVSDGMGHVVQTQLTSDPAGTDYVDTVYNGMGQISSVSNPHRLSSSSTDGTTSFAYDALGRKVTQTQPDGSTLQWCYNGLATASGSSCPALASSGASGSWVDSWDELGHHWQHVSDGLGRLVAVMQPDASTNALASETDYRYDGLDDLARVDQYAGKPGTADAVRVFTYDGLSRLLTAYNPETGSSTYTYDVNGNVSSKVDARNMTLRFSYDTLNRLLSKSTTDQAGATLPPFAIYAYDQTAATVGNSNLQTSNGIGRLTYSASADGTNAYCDAYAYDAMGRAVQKSFSWGCGNNNLRFTWTLGYDLAGDRTYYENGDWRAFYYGINGAGQVTSLTTGVSFQSPDANLVSGVGYDATGGAGTINLGNGAQEQLQRDNRGRLWSDNLQPAPGATNAIFGYNLSFDAAGNIKHMNDSYAMANWDYTFDGLNRLSTAVASLPYAGWNGTSGAQTAATGCQYIYDPFGNRTYMGPSGGGKQCATLSMNFGGNRIADGMTGYDAAGNLTHDGTSGNTYNYDVDGLLTSVTGPAGSASYFYDPEGQRVQSTVNGVTKTFSYDPDGHLAWTNFLSGGPEEVWLNGRHFGSVFANPDKTINHVVYSQVDEVGTERGQFDGNQNRIATFTSNPFGDNQQTTSGSNTDTTHFTGKERDTESGLDYFGARYYSSVAGGFSSPDWSASPEAVPYASLDNPQSLNLYAYVGNNPLSRVDANGHVWPWLQKIWNVISSPGILNDPKLSPAQRQAAISDAVAAHDEAAHELVTETIQLIGVIAESESPMSAPPTTTPGEVGMPSALTSPDIHPSEISGKFPSEIDATATGKGLIPKGADPQNGKGSYVDPVTGQQRVLSHPNADSPHAHVNNPEGQRLGPNGQVVHNESREAHLPIKKENQ